LGKITKFLINSGGLALIFGLVFSVCYWLTGGLAESRRTRVILRRWIKTNGYRDKYNKLLYAILTPIFRQLPPQSYEPIGPRHLSQICWSSGLLKLIYPHRGETEDEVEELLRLAMESRKRVKDQLFRIDDTYPEVDFHYQAPGGEKRQVRTVEEEEFPRFYHRKPATESETESPRSESDD